jgi:glutathione S-transferase
MNTVYGAVLSPFVRKVLMTLEHKGVEYVNQPIFPFRNNEAFAKISPLRKVPAFSDEYLTIADSSVICDYLENKYPHAPLYPKNPVERAKVLWLEEFADTRLQENLGPGLFFEKMVAPVMFKRAPRQDLIKKSLATLPALQDYLEGQLTGSRYAIGTTLSIADLSLPSVFLNGHYAGYDVDARYWPRLANYLQGMFAHPLYATRIEQERAALAALVPRT